MRRPADASSIDFASAIVQVSTEAVASPPITDFTTQSALPIMPRGGQVARQDGGHPAVLRLRREDSAVSAATSASFAGLFTMVTPQPETTVARAPRRRGQAAAGSAA